MALTVIQEVSTDDVLSKLGVTGRYHLTTGFLLIVCFTINGLYESDYVFAAEVSSYTYVIFGLFSILFKNTFHTP